MGEANLRIGQRELQTPFPQDKKLQNQNKAAKGTLHVAAVETGSFISKRGLYKLFRLHRQKDKVPSRRAAVIKIQSPLTVCVLPNTLQGPTHSLKPRGGCSPAQGRPQITILVVRSGHQAGLGKLEEKVKRDYW